MRGTYSEIYLDDAIRNMGEMIEYGEEACGVNQDLLLRMFIRSGYASRWEKGDPRVICGLSGTELCRRLIDGSFTGRETRPAPIVRYDTGEAYWRGFVLAYYQWRSGRTFSEILMFIGRKDLQRMYTAYHTASEEKTADELEALLLRRDSISRLQLYRKRLGMTQQELAVRSGVNLRTLQEYEAGRKNLRQAAAEKVQSLSAALWCSPSDLIGTSQD